jgi:cellulose synthase/poly-beta-1,6-N-acetylglucosamine synthase-like glycosyltransferase
MNVIAAGLTLLPVAAFGYAYVGYPLLLRAFAATRPRPGSQEDPAEWPLITITVPAYNAASSIGQVLENILACDYPADRRQIIVISDASSDGTDDAVRGFASRGVELLRMPDRKGKTAAESAAGRIARGSIVVNMDATVRILPQSIKALIRAFGDQSVGVASGCDVSVSAGQELNGGEASYVGYEMWLRDIETRLGGIVGASGCFYGFRRDVHDLNLPEELSRDFASALIAREHGYRSVSVKDAVCVVPRARSLNAEYERKIRTMARGLETLWYKRHLMNPVRYGTFAFMLISHKLCRWMVPLLLPVALVGLLVLGADSAIGAVALGLTIVGVSLGLLGMHWPGGRKAPRLVALAGYALASNLAGVLAWSRAVRGRSTPLWEPTRRPV